MKITSRRGGKRPTGKDTDMEEGWQDGSSRSIGDRSHISNIESIEMNLPASDKAEAIAKRETNIVRLMRLLMFALLAVCTGLMAYFVYDYLNNAETEAFKDDFASEANKVLESIGSQVDLTLGAVDAMVVSMISYARDTNQTWPFVTVPNFAIRATKTRRLAKAVSVLVYNKVEKHERADYEAYTATHGPTWVNESVYLQANDPEYYGPDYFDFYTADYIHDDNEEAVPERPVYLPTWQSSPCIPEWAPYNWEYEFFFSDFLVASWYCVSATSLFVSLHSFNSGMAWSNTSAYDAVLDSKQVIISEAYHLPDPNDPAQVEENELSAAWYGDMLGPNDHDPSEPITDIYYPMLDTIDEVFIENPGEEKIVAFLALSIYWRKFIEGVLPERSRGLVVVFSSPCNPTFTFQINGREVTYLGRGDFHDSQYDDMEVSSTLLDLSGLDKGTSFYSGIPINKDYCPFTVQLYPSELKEDNYMTNEPWVFAVIVGGIFCFISMVFFLFDAMVERRQKRVLKQATTSSNMVAALFPKAVRDRLYKEQEEKQEKEEQKKVTIRGPQLFRHDGQNPDMNSWQESGKAVEIKTKPIADLFPETTIFFADLVGFTSWSSGRSPEDVFVLLETIYGEFDKVALKRSVFKVETIGDCYVAATGLPKAQSDHAIRMVRFANDCLRKMSSVIADELVDKLGPETLKLTMRVGMHSGSCTAGVLRGIKGRFQLFGDTVNTAARMESNGQPGRIQVSQATADLLVKNGKEHWLTAREDKVQAKGKGAMQTYWVSIDSVAPTISSRRSGGTDETGNSPDLNDSAPNLLDMLGGAEETEMASSNPELNIAVVPESSARQVEEDQVWPDNGLPPREEETEASEDLQHQLSNYLTRGDQGDKDDAYFL